MATTHWRTPYSRLKKALKNSATKKRNAGWSREISAGFIEADINDIQYRKDGLRFRFSWGSQTIKISDLNLRETEEALKWAQRHNGLFINHTETRYRIEGDGKYHVDIDGSGRFGLIFSSYPAMRDAVRGMLKEVSYRG